MMYNLMYTLGAQPYAATYPGPNSAIGDDPKLREARQNRVTIFICPSDGKQPENEMDTRAYGFYRGNYRGCVVPWDMFVSSTFDTATA